MRLHRRLTRSGTDMAALAAVEALDLVRRDGEEDDLIRFQANGRDSILADLASLQQAGDNASPAPFLERTLIALVRAHASTLIPAV